jgi:hypothetical protein
MIGMIGCRAPIQRLEREQEADAGQCRRPGWDRGGIEPAIGGDNSSGHRSLDRVGAKGVTATEGAYGPKNKPRQWISHTLSFRRVSGAIFLNAAATER